MPEDILDTAERIAALVEAADFGLDPMDTVAVADELHDLMVIMDALPLELVMALDRLGIGSTSLR